MSDGPYIPFYTSDFLGGTGGMTAATKGVYITLICLIYEAEKPLAQSWETLARRCGATLPTFKKALQLLVEDEKVTITKEGIWSEKCEKHLTQRRERSVSAAGAAKKRWQKTQQKQDKPDANAMRTTCQPEPEPEPEIKEEDTNVSSKKVSPERFGEFWEIYPHRHGKKTQRASSEQKYAAAVKAGVSEQNLIDAARVYREDPDVLRGYGRSPVPWFNQRGWEDEPANPHLQIIPGGQNVQRASKSQRRMEAFIAGARG